MENIDYTFWVQEGPPDAHINHTAVRKDRKRITNPGGPVKDRSKAKGKGQNPKK